MEVDLLSRWPETRDSLLLKIRDSENAVAWERFAAVYRPAVVRLARQCGLQEADAEDLAQRVLVAVSRAIGSWEKDSERGSFHSWLLRIARNEMINMMTRGRRLVGRGGTSVAEGLEQHPTDDDALETLVEDEHRRAMFRWAAEEIRPEFHEATWRAFWLTAIEALPVEEAAMDLGKSVGSVYAARSRVMRRLKTKVREFDSE
jgi:RNA polymerase sigma factor (sigma-70 family)